MQDELYAIADRLVARAQPGEQVEVVVAHSKDTEVRVYEGEIESLSVAESQGVGVRVVADQRQGFASAGTFDPAALDEMLDEARDNARFAEPDEHLGLAEPDGVAVADLDLWSDDLAATDTDGQDRPGPRPRAGDQGRRRPHHRPRVRRVRRLHGHLGRRVDHRRAQRRLRDRGRPRRLRPGRGERRDPDRLRLLGRPLARATSTSTRPPTTPSTGPPACWAPPSRRPSA